MLKNIKNYGQKVRNLLVYLEVNLINTYLYARFLN